jgi:HAD superfamily hydrolase (TIGR01459 family)
MQKIKVFQDVLKDYDLFIIDVSGVLHNGVNAFDHALQSLKSIQTHNKKAVLLSNAPRRSKVLEESLVEKFGITPDFYNQIYSSGEAVYNFLEKSSLVSVYHFGSPTHRSLFPDHLSITPQLILAEYIVNTGFLNSKGLKDEDKKLFEEAIRLHIPMVCANPDMHALVKGGYEDCAGALALSYEKMGGKVIYFGKPYESVYQHIIEHTPISKILCIGDNLSTDILGAQNIRVDSLLVMTGIEAFELQKRDGSYSEEMLIQHCKQKEILPTYWCSAF